ncbi:MAG: hypothetical protein WA782_04180, partial [Sulfitobacter sp.]
STNFKDWPVSTATRPLLESGADVFIRFNEGVSILHKVLEVETGQDAVLSLPEDKRFDRLVSSRKPFGLETTFKGKKTGDTDDVKIEPPRVYRRVKLSKDEPYDTTQTHPVLHS